MIDYNYNEQNFGKEVFFHGVAKQIIGNKVNIFIENYTFSAIYFALREIIVIFAVLTNFAEKSSARIPKLRPFLITRHLV